MMANELTQGDSRCNAACDCDVSKLFFVENVVCCETGDVIVTLSIQ